MRIETSCEQRLGFRAMIAKYTEKKWSLSTVKARPICKRAGVTVTWSAVLRKPESGPQKTVREAENNQNTE